MTRTKKSSTAVAKETPVSEGAKEEKPQVPAYQYLAAVGSECLRMGEYSSAILYFESSLRNQPAEAEKYDYQHALQTRTQLVLARMNLDNNDTSLKKAVHELDLLIRDTTSKSGYCEVIDFHLGKVDALVRLLDFDAAGRSLVEALKSDRPKLLAELNLFLRQLAEKSVSRNRPDLVGLNVPRKTFDMEVTSKDLEDYMDNMAPPARQKVFSMSRKELHELVDGSLTEGVLGHKCEDCVKFLHECVDYNFNDSEKKSLPTDLLFLNQEIVLSLTQRLWEAVPIPDKAFEPFKPILSEKEKEEAQPEEEQTPAEPVKDEDVDVSKLTPSEIKAQDSQLVQQSAYLAEDGVELLSLISLDGIKSLSNAFRIRHKGHEEDADIVSLSLKYLNPPSGSIGLDLVRLLADARGVPTQMNEHVCGKHAGSDVCTGNEDWTKFVDSRRQAHMVFEVAGPVKLQELSREAQELLQDPDADGGIFEKKLAEKLGEDVQKRLTKREVQLSLPVLKDYAKLMHDISGIEEHVILFELTDQVEDDIPEEERDEELRHLAQQCKDYKPMGLANLVQKEEFKFDCSKPFERESVEKELQELERSVVKMQVDFRKEVETTAGEKYDDLQEVIQNLQIRGLCLTRWLRGFTQYMMDRRAVETNLLQQSGATDSTKAIPWFEHMQIRLSRAQSVLLFSMMRRMLTSLEQSRQEFIALREEHPNHFPASVLRARHPSLKPLFHQRSRAYLEHLLASLADTKVTSYNQLQGLLTKYFASEKSRTFSKSLCDTFGVDRLRVAVAEVAVPSSVIQAFFKQKPGDKHYNELLKHETFGPSLLEICVLMDRTAMCDDIVCHFVFSTVDKQLLTFGAMSAPRPSARIPAFRVRRTYQSQVPLSSLSAEQQEQIKAQEEANKKKAAEASTETAIEAPASEDKKDEEKFVTFRHHQQEMFPLCFACRSSFASMMCKKCGIIRYCSKQCQTDTWQYHQKACKEFAKMAARTRYVSLYPIGTEVEELS